MSESERQNADNLDSSSPQDVIEQHAKTLERLLEPYMGTANYLNGAEMAAIKAGAHALRTLSSPLVSQERRMNEEQDQGAGLIGRT